MLTSIPEHRVAIVRSFTRYLDDVGVPLEPAIRQAGLPVRALENAESFVPSHCFYSLVVNSARKHGIEELGFLVGEKYGANSVDPKLTKLLCQSNTLFRGLRTAIELTNKVVTNSRMWLLQPQGSRTTLFCHRPSFDKCNPAIEQIGLYGLLTMLNMVRTFTGAEWEPKVVGIISNRQISHYIRERFPNTEVRVSQPYSYITLDNALLSLRPPSLESEMSGSLPENVESVANNFVGSLEQILATYALESDLCIDLAAELCNTSKRTLQRKLAESGTRYSDILDQVRFKVASQKLLDRDLKVKDVARLLGYRHPTHFTRAFRRVSGVSPREFCQANVR